MIYYISKALLGPGHSIIKGEEYDQILKLNSMWQTFETFEEAKDHVIKQAKSDIKSLEGWIEFTNKLTEKDTEI